MSHAGGNTDRGEVAPGNSSGNSQDDSPLISICLASYNPDGERLARQIKSILNQSYKNWLLIISDDHSEPVQLDQIKQLCELDPERIRLYQHDQNVGFYHNFERALTYVPDDSDLIAFSDQDDDWYPHKLQTLRDELSSKTSVVLAYSDMRIVSQSGELISNTYWQNRNNEYRDFNTVFIANTVTGAASLFKSELLEVILPFPERIGETYHDHWVACCAMSTGDLAYVSEPLYDYIQYSDSVIGHCDFNSEKPVQTTAKTSREKWQQVYQQDCLRLQLMADTLKKRLPEASANSTLNLMNGGIGSVIKLMKVYLVGRLMRRTTNGAELALMMGFLRGQ